MVYKKWDLLILRQLIDGPLAFGKLKEKLPGISDHVLNENLKKLTKWGLIEKEIATRPLRKATLGKVAGRGEPYRILQSGVTTLNYYQNVLGVRRDQSFKIKNGIFIPLPLLKDKKTLEIPVSQQAQSDDKLFEEKVLGIPVDGLLISDNINLKKAMKKSSNEFKAHIINLVNYLTNEMVLQKTLDKTVPDLDKQGFKANLLSNKRRYDCFFMLSIFFDGHTFFLNCDWKKIIEEAEKLDNQEKDMIENMRKKSNASLFKVN